jgi:hypothetical protein
MGHTINKLYGEKTMSIGSLVNKTATVAFDKAVDAVPTLVSVGTYTDTAMEITEIMIPLHAALAGFRLIAKRCFSIKMNYLAECIALTTQSWILISTGGAWHSVPIFFWLAKQVLKKKLKGE